MTLKSIFRFLFASFVLISFSVSLHSKDKPDIDLIPSNKYENLLVSKVLLAFKITKKINKEDFHETYDLYGSKFEDFFSMDYFSKAVLGTYYNKLTPEQLKTFKNSYFVNTLLLIQQLKNGSSKETKSISFYEDTSKYEGNVLPISIKIEIFNGVQPTFFRLIFLMDKDKKIITNVLFRDENILDSHKKQFTSRLKKQNIPAFLKSFENDIRQKL